MESTSTLEGSSRSHPTRNWVEFVRYRTVPIIGLIVLTLASFIVLAPFAWTVATSLRLPAQSFTLPPKWIPTNPDWSNYERVFEEIQFFRMIFNSAFVAVLIVIGQLATASLAGYAFGRLEFPGRRVLFWIVMATMMIPLQATIIPVFVLISRMGLNDTLASLILPSLPTAFGTFLLRQYFMAVPKDFEEASLIDGANQFQIFSRIYLPLVAPGLAVLAVLVFNTHWNEFFRPLIFLLSRENFTIPLGLNVLKGYMMTGSISVVLAGVAMSLIPVMAVYAFGQRYLIEGIMMGGVKG
jgi:multiple sugar transport system permease protein